MSKNNNKKEFLHQKIERHTNEFKKLKEDGNYGKLFLFTTFNIVLPSIGKIMKTCVVIFLITCAVFGYKVFKLAQDVGAVDFNTAELTNLFEEGEGLSEKEQYDHCVELIKGDSRFSGISEKEIDEYAKKLVEIRYQK